MKFLGFVYLAVASLMQFVRTDKQSIEVRKNYPQKLPFSVEQMNSILQSNRKDKFTMSLEQLEEIMYLAYNPDKIKVKILGAVPYDMYRLKLRKSFNDTELVIVSPTNREITFADFKRTLELIALMSDSERFQDQVVDVVKNIRKQLETSNSDDVTVIVPYLFRSNYTIIGNVLDKYFPELANVSVVKVADRLLKYRKFQQIRGDVEQPVDLGDLDDIPMEDGDVSFENLSNMMNSIRRKESLLMLTSLLSNSTLFKKVMPLSSWITVSDAINTNVSKFIDSLSENYSVENLPWIGKRNSNGSRSADISSEDDDDDDSSRWLSTVKPQTEYIGTSTKPETKALEEVLDLTTTMPQNQFVENDVTDSTTMKSINQNEMVNLTTITPANPPAENTESTTTAIPDNEINDTEQMVGKPSRWKSMHHVKASKSEQAEVFSCVLYYVEEVVRNFTFYSSKPCNYSVIETLIEEPNDTSALEVSMARNVLASSEDEAVTPKLQVDFVDSPIVGSHVINPKARGRSEMVGKELRKRDHGKSKPKEVSRHLDLTRRHAATEPKKNIRKRADDGDSKCDKLWDEARRIIETKDKLFNVYLST